MQKVSKKTILITSIITVLPILAGLILWSRLPDTMATHFGADGQANGWSSKGFAVFGLPLIMLATHLICIFASANDPKNKNYSEKLFVLVLWICPVLSILVSATILVHGLGYEMNVTKYVLIFTAILFIIMGNYLPKCKHNYTMGVKLPWTLADENNWNATHRLAGFVWVICGFVMLMNAFVFNEFVFIGLISVSVLVPSVYSYLYYRKHGVQKKEEE